MLRFKLKKQRSALPDLMLTCSVQERFGFTSKPRSFIEGTRSITRLLRKYSCDVLQISFVYLDGIKDHFRQTIDKRYRYHFDN